MEDDVFKSLHNMLRRDALDPALRCILDFDTARIRKPYNADINHAWYVVGDIYYRLGDFSQSLRAFRAAFLKNNDDYQAAKAIGNCYSEMGRYKMAERFYKKAILLNKEDLKEDLELIYNIGNALFDQKKFKEAVCAYEKVLDSEKANRNLLKMAKNNLVAAKKKSARE